MRHRLGAFLRGPVVSGVLQWTGDADHDLASTGDIILALERPVDLSCFTVSKTSGGNITALTVARSLNGGVSYGPARTVTLAAALSSVGDAVDVDLVDECPTHVKFRVTVSAETVVHIAGRALLR